ncbi:inositol monophosphatase family protein [Pseudonocardia sp. HH130630-07]|uniref:inositol monophosphatase family protein n=1 Tax=Pseudonocardia sp. HH130630-07 TaxID=1690815 RepID=UPI000814ECF8|nr:inositol monophosphatase family protein [Pseudonocardia sp. HH130630-07]ANY05368.1 hypothetical protein AFB00_02500 [Pseudonocardia sp. HH130630-07]
MRQNLTEDVELAIAAARAGMAALARSGRGGFDRTPKSGDDFSTPADVAAERAVRATIAQRCPGDTIRGEELPGTDGAGARVWLVDPLCGTRNFASGSGACCTNVALAVGGTPVVAAVGDLGMDGVYWTDGRVAAIRDRSGDRPIRPGTANRIVEVNADGADDVTGPALVGSRRFRRWMTPRVSATTLSLAWVAAGSRIAYVSDGDLRRNLHFAAGIALCLGAGCLVTDLRGGNVDSGAGLLVSAGPEVHADLVDHVAAVRSVLP